MKRIILVVATICLYLSPIIPKECFAYTMIDRGWTDPISMPKTFDGISYNDYAWFNAGNGWLTMLFYNANGDSGCTPFHNLYQGNGNWVSFGVHGSCHWFRTDCNTDFSNCTSDDYSAGILENYPWGGSFWGFNHSTRDIMKSSADLGDYTPYGISDQVYQNSDRQSGTFPFSYYGPTYTQKVIGYDFDGTAAGYERELYTPADSGIWINHSGQDSHGDFLVTGLFTGNASETISAHDGIFDNSGFQDHIQLNETKNCFATIKSNVDIRWTTNLGQYGNTDNCGSYHAEGDLVVPKNLNENGTEPTDCIFPLYCTFQDFTNSGVNIRDANSADDYVRTMDVFYGVPSFLNSKNYESIGSSYYQCTEFVARYLHSRFSTDYSDSKNVADSDKQGFRGFDFHPNYGGNPTVEKGGIPTNLTPVSSPRVGDVAMFSSGHAAVVKKVAGETSVRLIEQNFADRANHKYTIEREITLPLADLSFFRYPAAVVGETNSVSSTIQDAYNSASDGQTVKMQTQVFNENLDLSNSVAVSLLGGYDPNFQTVSGWTTIFGSLTIRSGTVVVDGICIQ